MIAINNLQIVCVFYKSVIFYVLNIHFKHYASVLWLLKLSWLNKEKNVNNVIAFWINDGKRGEESESSMKEKKKDE